MTRRRAPRATRTLGRIAGFLAAVALFAPAGALGPATAVAAQTTLRSDNVAASDQFRIQVRSMSPSAPLASTDAKPFSVVLSLTNLTGKPLDHITISGRRGDPIANRDALATALDRPFTSAGLNIGPRKPVTVDLPADARAHDVTFATTTGIPTDSGICLCHNAVYPLSFTASYTEPDGDTAELGTAGTFMPAFDLKPEPVRVSWVWPLIDRPHRLADDRTFIDDDLTNSVSFDGRLSRSLAVLEQIAGSSIPVTIVVDPELLDELQVMASGKYTVRQGKHRVPGEGAAAAHAWLARFQDMLQAHPSLRVAATPYADADVQSLIPRGLSWQRSLPTDMSQRVTAALGRHALDDDLIWAAAGRLGTRSLGKLSTAGVRQVVLASASVTPADGANGSVPDGTAQLSRHGHRIGAALTDATLQRYVASVVTRNSPGLAQLPQLMSEIAVRAAQDPTTPHNLVLTPPRYVDPDPQVAAQAVEDTSTAPFTQAAKLDDLLSPDRLPGHLSRLTKVTPSVPGLPGSIIDSAHHVASTLPTIASLLGSGSGPHIIQTSVAGVTALKSLPLALQRTESAYWASNPTRGSAFARQLGKQVESIVDGVQIVQPKSGVYTLASSNASLPVTVKNDLTFPVAVRLKVSTLNGLPGFTARDIGAQRIDANGQRTLKLPTSIARSGTIRIQAQLMTPSQQSLGAPIPLSVHSSAFGVVGVVITIVAGAVLFLALLVRGLKVLRSRQHAQRSSALADASTSAEEADSRDKTFATPTPTRGPGQ